MNIPCPNHVICNPCQDSPLANLSSEAPDVELNRYTAYAKLIPPLGTAFTQLSCQYTAAATDPNLAQLEAQLGAELCVISGWTNPGQSGLRPNNSRVPPPQSPSGGGHFPQFLNAAQEGEATCPDGTPFFFPVAAGLFLGRTQLAADTAALSYANANAQFHLLCLSDITLTACEGVSYFASISATSLFSAVAPQTNLWQITSGSLPPGLVFNGGAISGPASLDGTPSVPGQYNFVIGVTLPNGDFNQKEYAFTVAGITNGTTLPAAQIGTAYSATLSAIGFNNPQFSTAAVLPAGLFLFANGTISGTPANNALSESFPVTVTDSATGFNCQQSVTITVKAGCGSVPTQQWTVTLTPSPSPDFVGMSARTTPASGQHQMVGISNTDESNTIVISVRMDNQSIGSLSLAGDIYMNLCYSPVNDVFVLAGLSGIARVGCEPLSLIGNNAGYGDFAQAMGFCPFNNFVYIADGDNFTAYDPVHDTIVGQVSMPAPVSSGGPVGYVTFDVANKIAYVAANTSGVSVLLQFDISHNVPVLLNQFSCPGTPVYGAFLCPDNKLVYVNCNNVGPSITRFNPATGLFQNSQTASAYGIPFYNPTSKLMFDGGYDFICAFTDAQIGSVTPNQFLDAVSFSPFNNSLVFCNIATGNTQLMLHDYA